MRYHVSSLGSRGGGMGVSVLAGQISLEIIVMGSVAGVPDERLQGIDKMLGNAQYKQINNIKCTGPTQ